MPAKTSTNLFTPISKNQDLVVRELPADLETPVSVYLKLAGRAPSFLLESVTGGEQVARYSFIGAGLRQAYVLRQGGLKVHQDGQAIGLLSKPGESPLETLRHVLEPATIPAVPTLPRFTGGLVGYLGYETSHDFEPSVPLMPGHGNPEDAIPQAIFLLADTVVAYDHAYGRLVLMATRQSSPNGSHSTLPPEARLEAIERRLAGPLPPAPSRKSTRAPAPLKAHTRNEHFLQAVRQAKDHITAGDIFQVVLSQRFSRQTSAGAFEIYRALRRLNPSPYMFFFDFGSLAGGQPLRLIGASPEMHVRLEGRQATLRPIAGTRRRGATSGEDQALERELLSDPKERAEHVMLVDLARNDLGRVCRYGSVKVPQFIQVERYSHVMHLVSQVEGELRPDLDAFDLMQATFPAGTVSGAPKIRAMQIIAELEALARGPYAGAVGYFSFDGSMDTCITIRTLVMQGQQVSVQAGAGIVADSDPEREYQETLHKSRALAEAVEMAEASHANSSTLDERRLT
jgi:anthranilate synthase component 1